MARYVFIGASSTMARALGRLTSYDNELILLTRQPETLEEDLTQNNQVYQVDPTDYQQMLDHFQTIAKQGHVDGVVNFCGNLSLKPIHLIEPGDWHQTLNINLTTAYNTLKAAVKTFKEHFSVVLISSAAASVGLPNHEAIAAAKAGVEGLAKSFSATYAKQKIRCNVVAPGLTSTHLTQQIFNSSKGYELSKSLHATERLGDPDDIARCIQWLLDPNNDWVTAEVIHVDGGLSQLKTY